jgi:phage terminase Nu1 subunit (DNA packaging protein)
MTSEQPANSTEYIVSTQNDVANFFHRALPTIRDWKKAGMPGKAGAWNLSDIAAWLIDNRPNTAEHRSTDDTKKLADARFAVARAEKMELATAFSRGELCRVDEASRDIRERALRIKDRILRVPGEVRPYIPKPQRRQVETAVSNYIRGLLTEISQWKSTDEPPGATE